MTESHQCPRCGAKLPADAPGGHCISCLLQLGLAADEPDAPDAAPTATIRIVPPSQMATEKPGDRIGRYKLLQQIGEGGCGVVYMAEQEEPVRRRVALKVIKLGMDTKQVIARFEAERQALVLMDHPNIAKVLDAGATETGRPYFVMELVRGIKITDYCDQQKLSTRQRLDLFVQVCQAVQHAHQKGIIHRDLKPSNILVTEQDGKAVPKIIDFGIAKATTDQRLTDKTLFTAFEQFIGTPAYMSPEQAGLGRLDVDTRSDIYSLGVLLYELLTGHPPFESDQLARSALHEILRVIREVEPPRPSARLTTLTEQELTTVAQRRHSESAKLSTLVRGDLDWIVMKPLDKDRTRRYETANGLARDIERHLNNEPVVARPPGNLYRLQKSVRRNKLAFAAVGSVIVALLLGVVVSSWQAMRATRAEREQSRLLTLAQQSEAKQLQLRREAESARQTEAQLRQQAEAARVRAEADEKKAQTESAKSQQVAQFLTDMLQGVGPSVALGRDTKMLREILDKTAGRLNELTNQPAVEADLRSTLGKVYSELSEYTNAAAMHQRALELRKKLFGDESAEVANSMNDLGEVLFLQGKFLEAEAMHRSTLAMRKLLFGEAHPDIATSLNNLGMTLLREKRDSREAAPLLRAALAMRRKFNGNVSLEVARTLSNLGLVLRLPGRSVSSLPEAETMEREALDIEQKLLGADHPEVAAAFYGLGMSLVSQTKYSEAEAAFRSALAIRLKILPTEHPAIAQTLAGLAFTLSFEGKLAETETLRRQALAMLRKLFGEGHPDVASAITLLAAVLQLENKLPEAEMLTREALVMQRKLSANGSPDVTRAMRNLIEVLLQEGKREEAELLAGELPEKDKGIEFSHIAGLYDQGRPGLSRNRAEGTKWFLKAAELGFANAQYQIGVRYLGYIEGSGLEKNVAEGIRWIRKGAEKGDFWAQQTLGSCYENGYGVSQDFAEAIKWYRAAISRNYHWSGHTGKGIAVQELLALMFETGRGVSKSQSEAANWYAKAAEIYRDAAQQGNSDAQMNLGRFYSVGLGVAKNEAEAAKWYGEAMAQMRKACESGSPVALNGLAWFLATCGSAIVRNGTNAIAYAEKAVAATKRTDAIYLDTLAAAYAEAGDFAKAVSVQQEAIALLKTDEEKKDYATRLKLYESNSPYHENK